MIVNVFLVWIENFPGDFKTDGDNSLLKQLQIFAKSELKLTHSKELLRKIEQLLDKPQLNRKWFLIMLFFVFVTCIFVA